MARINPVNQSDGGLAFYREMEELYKGSPFTSIDKLQNSSKYVPIVDTGRFLAKYHIFQQILDVPGHIMECGVYQGGGLMTWAQLSTILEPLNHVRRIVGFDTFEGFASVNQQDRETSQALVDQTDFSNASLDELKECIRLYDLYRPLGHIPRVEIVQGDATRTIPDYVDSSPHLVVALLYLDFDIYEPTKCAIETFLPRMPRGAVIAFDELIHPTWPGETMALADSLGISSLRLKRFPWQPQITYAVLEEAFEPQWARRAQARRSKSKLL